jgi:hypothetical protein
MTEGRPGARPWSDPHRPTGPRPKRDPREVTVKIDGYLNTQIREFAGELGVPIVRLVKVMLDMVSWENVREYFDEGGDEPYDG